MAAILVLILASLSFGDDAPKPDVLQQMYKDTLAQLKTAQDRKNELAADNDKLTARISELEKQLADNQASIDALRRERADFSSRNFTLRAWYAAWQGFLSDDSDLRARWNVFLDHSLLTYPASLPEIDDVDLPTTRPTRLN
jgi:DNA repair ATPase RecN